MATGFELKRLRTTADSDVSVAILAKAMGVDAERLAKWEQRDSTPRPGDARRVMDFFDIEDLSELSKIKKLPSLYKKKGAYTEIDTSDGIKRSAYVERPDGALARRSRALNDVPYYDVDFVAGDGDGFSPGASRPEYIMRLPGLPGCIAFNNYNDSMEELIKSGSILFGRVLEDWQTYMEYGRIYAIVTNDDRRFLKYIRRAADKEATHFLLCSENTRYEPFDLPRTHIRALILIEGWTRILS